MKILTLCRFFCQLAIFGLILAFAPMASADAAVSIGQVVSAITADNVEDSEFYAREIVTSCPVNSCVIVSLGQVNTLLDSFVRNEMRNRGIAAGYLRYAPFIHLTSVSDWSPRDQDLWVRKTFGEPSELKGKTVMLMRTLAQGRTVNRLYATLRESFKRQGYDCKVAGFYIAGSQVAPMTEILGPYKAPSKIYLNPSFYQQFALRRLSNEPNPIEEFGRYKTISLARGLDRSQTNLDSLWQENPRYIELDRWVSQSTMRMPGARSNSFQPYSCLTPLIK